MSLEQALQANTQALQALLAHLQHTPVAFHHSEALPTPALKQDARPKAAPAPTPAPAPSPEPAQHVAHVDRSQVQQALLNVAKAQGKAAAVSILDTFGVKGLADLPEDQYAACLHALNKALTQGNAA